MKLLNPAVALFKYIRAIYPDAPIDAESFQKVAADLEQPMTRDEARAAYPTFDRHCRIVEQMDAEDPNRTLDLWERQRRYDEGLRE